MCALFIDSKLLQKSKYLPLPIIENAFCRKTAQFWAILRSTRCYLIEADAAVNTSWKKLCRDISSDSTRPDQATGFHVKRLINFRYAKSFKLFFFQRASSEFYNNINQRNDAFSSSFVKKGININCQTLAVGCEFQLLETWDKVSGPSLTNAT